MQLRLLERLTENDKIVYTNRDNGLGIAAVELYKYIQWGLKHLRDPSTYEIIPEEKAWTEVRELKKEIYHWTVKHRASISDDAVSYIRAKLDKHIDNPFSYFLSNAKTSQAQTTGLLNKTSLFRLWKYSASNRNVGG